MSIICKILSGRAVVLAPVFVGPFRSKLTMYDGEEVFSKFTPKQVLNQACIQGLSTMKGREIATRITLKYCRKTPFIVIPGIAVVPMTSPDNPACMYIFNHYFEIQQIGKALCKIVFLNGLSLEVPVSKHTLERQRDRMFTMLIMLNQLEKQQSFLAYIKRS